MQVTRLAINGLMGFHQGQQAVPDSKTYFMLPGFIRIFPFARRRCAPRGSAVRESGMCCFLKGWYINIRSVELYINHNNSVGTFIINFFWFITSEHGQNMPTTYEYFFGCYQYQLRGRHRNSVTVGDWNALYKIPVLSNKISLSTYHAYWSKTSFGCRSCWKNGRVLHSATFTPDFLSGFISIGFVPFAMLTKQ